MQSLARGGLGQLTFAAAAAISTDRAATTAPQCTALRRASHVPFTEYVAVFSLRQIVRAKEDKKQYIQLNKSLMNMSMGNMSRPGSAQVGHFNSTYVETRHCRLVHRTEYVCVRARDACG